MSLSRMARIRRSLRYRGAAAADRTAYSVAVVAQWIAARRVSRRPLPVTLVVTGRNDDYMPDFSARLDATLAWNLRHLAADAVFVEWNPPAERPLLAPDLTARHPSLRAYVVPPSVHTAVCRNPFVPLLEFHAKNVGIRRATQPWVFVTNADGAVGMDSSVRLRRRVLDPRIVWTAQRIDIDWSEGGRRTIRLLDLLRRRRVIPFTPYGSGEFTLAHASAWSEARGYDEEMDRHRSGCDVRGTRQMEIQGRHLFQAGSVYHLAHPTSCTEGVKPHHGQQATFENLPYTNPASWGLAGSSETEIAPRVWRLG